MSVSKIALAAVAALALAACGPDETIYRIAVDKTPLTQLPGTCYTSGAAPTDLTTTTGLFDDLTWSFFSGSGSNQYLDIGTNFGNAYRLGDAPRVSFSGLVQGQNKVFSASSSQLTQPGGVARTDAHDLTVTFTDLGVTAKGTVLLRSTVTCTGCGAPSCEATLNFDGHQIQTQQITTP